MKFLFFIVCVVNSLPWSPFAVPITRLVSDVAHGQEDVMMHHIPNFFINDIFRGPLEQFKVWFPENLYRTTIRKMAIPYDPTLAITGFPRMSKVEFYAYPLNERDSFLFVSQEIVLKNYRRASDYRFEKNGEIVLARIAFEGYKKGHNIIATDKAAVLNQDNLSGILSSYFTRQRTSSQFTDLELVKRYPDSIPRVSYVGGTGYSLYYPIVPPAKFWQHHTLFEVIPLSEFIAIHRMNELGGGLHRLDVELKLKFGNERKLVKFTFVVTKEPDHIAIKRILHISYPSSTSFRFSRDESPTRSTTTLQEATEFLNREVFGHHVGVPAPENALLSNGDLQGTRRPAAIGVPVEVVGHPVPHPNLPHSN